MSDLTITAKLVGQTKNNHKLQIDKESGSVGAVYVPKNLPLPTRIIIEVKQ